MSNRTVIVINGGEQGSLLSSPAGVRGIPAFAPAIRLNLVAAANMVRAAAAAREEEMARKLAREATNLANMAVEQVEQVVGPLDRERAIIFQDEDGGFTCGSVGKPPIPLPWPPPERPELPELLAAGVVDTGLLELIHAARSGDVKLTRVFEDPARIAQELGVSISEQSAESLQLLSPAGIDRFADEVDQEIVRYFHEVIEDGRYLDTWQSRPYEVSRELNVGISEEALERLNSGMAEKSYLHLGARGGDVASIGAGVIVAGIAITIGIVGELASAALDDIEKMVVDRSGQIKL